MMHFNWFLMLSNNEYTLCRLKGTAALVIVEDLIDVKTGQIIPKKYSVQIPGIPKLKFDGSKIVERDGTHWPMNRALNKEELDTLLRTGTCVGCHQNMTDKELW